MSAWNSRETKSQEMIHIIENQSINGWEGIAFSLKHPQIIGYDQEYKEILYVFLTHFKKNNFSKIMSLICFSGK